jgi:hypothetical protein
MERFIAQANIARFEEMLTRETDPKERRLVETLLFEERIKLRAAEAKRPVAQPPRPFAPSEVNVPC